jgi:hypothetical protein
MPCAEKEARDRRTTEPIGKFDLVQILEVPELKAQAENRDNELVN